MNTGSGQYHRPKAPNIQIYRPQLTSVLSIANRISAVVLTTGIIALVVWLVAIASGGRLYRQWTALLSTPVGQSVLFLYVLVFLFHVLSGLRHLYWDSGRGFRLASIYRSGWAVLFASFALSILIWLLAQP